MTREQELTLHHWAFTQVSEEYRQALASNASTFVLLAIQVRLNAIREQYMNVLTDNLQKAA